MKSYQPNAIIMQCGADGLAGDKLGGFNLTVKSYAYCVKYILSLCKPTLLLGGGNNKPLRRVGYINDLLIFFKFFQGDIIKQM